MRRWIAVAALLLAPGLAWAQLGPAPGLPASTLGQPNGPAQLGADGSVAGGIYAGNAGDPLVPSAVVRLDGGGYLAANANAAGGMMVNRNTFGNWNNGSVASFVANSPGQHASLSGFTTPSGVAIYHSADNATLSVQMLAPPVTVVDTNATFDATHYFPSTPLTTTQIAALQPQMFIETSHSPSFMGQITAIDPAGASVTVSGWFQTGNTAAGQNPQTVGTGPFTANVNVVNSALSAIYVSTLGPQSYAKLLNGIESDVVNSTGSFASAGIAASGSDVPSAIAFRAYCPSVGNCDTGLVITAKGGGEFQRGVTSLSGSLAGFIYAPKVTQGIGFLTTQTSGNLFQHLNPSNGGTVDFLAASGGALILGANAGTHTTPYLDMHSSGHNLADLRIIPTGGTGAYDGSVAYQAASHNFTGNLTTTGSESVGTTLAAAGFVDIGSQSAAATVRIGLHSSGSATPDGLIYSLGGTAGTQGAGQVRTVAAISSFFDATNTAGLNITPTSSGNVTVKGSGGGFLALQSGSTSPVYLGTTNGNGIEIDDGGTAAVDPVHAIASHSGASARLYTSAASNLALGGAGGIPTTSAGGMIQIPYMAGAPTGSPATNGGATVVYNTTSHSLNIYDPTAASWYHVALTAGGG